MKATRHSEAGMAILETALALPVLLLVLFAICELGLAFARFQIVQNAAREGARAATLFRASCTPQVVRDAVNEAVDRFEGGVLGLTGLTPELSFPDGGDACTAATVRVRLTFRHEIPLTAGFMGFFGGSGQAAFISIPGESTAANPPRRTSP